MKKIILVILTAILFTKQGFSAPKSIQLGIYVSDDETNNCAYLVSKNLPDEDNLAQPGVCISFIHDPRYMPARECIPHGITHYPIGIEILDRHSFLDLRAEPSKRKLFRFYGPSLLDHDDL